MKTIIKYISLLLFSGLILPFYNSSTIKTPVVKAIISINGPRSLKVREGHCFIYQLIADSYFPGLTN